MKPTAALFARDVSRTEYPRRIAFHEAGHAAAMCRLGFGIDYAMVAPRGCVLRPDRDGTGYMISCPDPTRLSGDLGICVGRFRLRASETQRATLRNRAFRAMVCVAAGPVAERRYARSKPGGVGCVLGDIGQMEGICERFLPYDDSSGMDRAFTAARCIVRDHWTEITAVADVLAERGYISAVHPILRVIKPWRVLPAQVVGATAK